MFGLLYSIHRIGTTNLYRFYRKCFNNTSPVILYVSCSLCSQKHFLLERLIFYILLLLVKGSISIKIKIPKLSLHKKVQLLTNSDNRKYNFAEKIFFFQFFHYFREKSLPRFSLNLKLFSLYQDLRHLSVTFPPKFADLRTNAINVLAL